MPVTEGDKMPENGDHGEVCVPFLPKKYTIAGRDTEPNRTQWLGDRARDSAVPWHWGSKNWGSGEIEDEVS